MKLIIEVFNNVSPWKLTNRYAMKYTKEQKKEIVRIRSKHYDGFDKEQRGLCMCLNQFGR